MTQTHDLVENMCNLYTRVNASPNVGKFELLKYLKDSGWHCELYSTSSDDAQYTKLAKWCNRNYGTVYHDVDNPSGSWYHFINKTGSCIDHIFAFRHKSSHEEFLQELDRSTRKKGVLNV